MSIEIANINNSSSPTPIDRKMIGFKSTAIPNDRIEITNKKKELTDWQKIGIGLGIIGVLALGTELVGYKGKHLKKIWEKITGKKPPKTPENKGVKDPSAEAKNVYETIADFKNISDAKRYFENIGISTVFKDGAERHLADLNQIKGDLALLEKNGVALPKPETIIMSDWHNIDELKQIFRSLNIREEEADICHKFSGFWGTVKRGSDNKCHVIINTSFSGNYGKFIHEMGHIHHDYLNSSYLHTKVRSEEEFLKKQMEILGISRIGLSSGYIDSLARDGDDYIKSILRVYNMEDASSETFAKIKRLFHNIETNGDCEKVFSINGKDGKTYAINAKRMVDMMANESGVYAPTKMWENVAEIFQGLNEGKTYSDLVMLMYDLNGGGRVPNLVIKGKKYDDYIESLYNNKDLIRQLRETIDVKEFV